MEVKVLGPLVARRNGISVAPTAPKPRQVLSLLVLRAGQLVTIPALIEELWKTTAPRSAVQVIQTYILRLRKLIALSMTEFERGSAKQILITHTGGYLLDIAPATVDAHRYQELAAAGERAIERGDDEAGSRLLGEALAIWRGPALADVPIGTLLGIEVVRLEQSRLGMVTSRIDAELRLGRHHHLLGELAELNARYPLHEKLCAQYMTALHISGCTWRALEVFRTLRRRLVDELGIEPSVKVQHLQNAILNADIESDLLKVG